MAEIADLYNDGVALDVLEAGDAAIKRGHLEVTFDELKTFAPAGSFLQRLNLA